MNNNNGEFTFNNAQYAADVKANNQLRLEKIKNGLIAAGVTQVWWLIIILSGMSVQLGEKLAIVGLIGSIVSYVLGGGLPAAIKFTWNVAKKLGYIGWFCVPFPYDIFTGLLLLGVAFLWGICGFFMFPLVVIFFNYMSVKKETKAAEDYLQYCTSAESAQTQEVC